MELESLLDRLGYTDSATFLRSGGGKLESAIDVGHVFRQAKENPCNLQGVYTLNPDPEKATGSNVPVIYVCQTQDEQAVGNIHRLVWNQDIAPFILLLSPRGVRLYSGFEYKKQPTGDSKGIIRPLTAFNKITDLVKSLNSEAIDSGRIWQDYGAKVRPEARVDWRLLDSLNKLDDWLQRTGLEPRISHALIGKYVFLHFLRARKILSDRKLDSWGIEESDVFGRETTIDGLEALIERLEAWLNGGVFPLNLRGKKAPTLEQLRRVAATFKGETLVGVDDWQLHLDFQAYDFSYIPIETLSVIYEQFLHQSLKKDKSKKKSTSKGREAGAYYTAIPVVNFMLTELEQRRPLKRGDRVFDPSCGSGAFLVQAYRRLIEKEYPPTDERRPTPAQLGELLTKYFFGVDRDEDACNVTVLSLLMTLLDYVKTPDLEQSPRFKLPALLGSNVVNADFFSSDSAELNTLRKQTFDVVLGNPPWKSLNPKKIKPEDKKTWRWIEEKKDEKETPIAGNQVAQAFVWAIREFVKPDSEVALLLPAMTLFEDRSQRFRSAFFQYHRVHAVANFANLAEVLFAGRSRVPAAAFFYKPIVASTLSDLADHSIETFSPFVANQEANRPTVEGEREETWSLVINASEIRDIPQDKAESGNGLVWKLAMWGGERDRRLLRRLERKFSTLQQMEKSKILLASQGLELREPPPKKSEQKEVEFVQEVIGKNLLDVKELEELRHLFVFPSKAIKPVPESHNYVRKGRSKLPLSVCQSPHIIISAARNFAILSNEYLIVPPRQIGIISLKGDSNFLKALSLYLSSDFAFYHQFLTATQFGVQRGRSTLHALRKIPLPFDGANRVELKKWADLHARLIQTEPLQQSEIGKPSAPRLPFDHDQPDLHSLLDELNERVYAALGLDDRERALVRDLVDVKLQLNDGKCGQLAVMQPNNKELRTYATRLKKELDGFLGELIASRHQVAVVFEEQSAMVQVELLSDAKSARKINVVAAAHETAEQLVRTRNKLRQKTAQWVYFDRNLRIYEGRRVYIFKPMQRFHWTQSQAMQDATEIIAETLSAREVDR